MTRDPGPYARKVRIRFEDVDNMTKLLEQQQPHLSTLSTYAVDHCGLTTGMTNLMSLLVRPVKDVSDYAAGHLRRSSEGIGESAYELGIARERFRVADDDNAVDLSDIFLNPMPGRKLYRDLGGDDQLPAGGDYNDTWEVPDPPSHFDDPPFTKEIEGHKQRLVGRYEAYWAALGPEGGSLIAKIITPIVGDYRQFYGIHTAYKNAGTSTYQVAGNVRKGTIAIASTWDGLYAENFEFLMFCWGQGLGGLGDLLQIISKTFLEIYTQVVKVLQSLMEDMYELTERYFPRVDDVLNRNEGSFEYDECGSLSQLTIHNMPDDQMKELKDRMRDVAEQVEKIRKKIDQIEEFYKKAEAKFQAIENNIELVREKGIDGAVGDMLTKQYEKRAIAFELDESHWDPSYGFWRLLMLPT